MKQIIIRKNKSTSNTLCTACAKNYIVNNLLMQELTKLKNLYLKFYKKEFLITDLCLACIKFNLEQLLELQAHNQPHSQQQPQQHLQLKQITEINGVKKGNCIFAEITKNSDTWNQITNRITNTTIEIIRIEQSYNVSLLSNYLGLKFQLFNDNTANSPSFNFSTKHQFGENYMFHGSSNKAYDAILDTGFDITYSKSTGLLGKGIYFAENASYSTAYVQSLQTDIGTIGIMLICRVLLGKITVGSSGITCAPQGYNSVSWTDGNPGDIYAVFNNFQAYPEFIIYYSNLPKLKN